MYVKAGAALLLASLFAAQCAQVRRLETKLDKCNTAVTLRDAAIERQNAAVAELERLGVEAARRVSDAQAEAQRWRHEYETAAGDILRAPVGDTCEDATTWLKQQAQHARRW